MTNVVGLFETRDQARRAIEALKAAGLKSEDMSIVMRDRTLAEEVAEDTGADNSEAVGVGAVGGGVIGGMAGLLVGLGVIAIPGIGPFLAAGPLAAALTGGAVGATAGGMAGALIHHGVSEEDAGFYSSAVERGGILVTVKTAKKREAEVRRVLEANGMKSTEYHQSLWEQDPEFTYDIRGESDMSTNEKHTDNRDKAKVRRTDVDVVETDADFDDTAFRAHHKTHFAKAGSTFDAYSPAYRFGYDYATDNPQHGEWAVVEPEARRTWEKANKGTWEQFKDAVHHGWQKVTGAR